MSTLWSLLYGLEKLDADRAVVAYDGTGGRREYLRTPRSPWRRRRGAGARGARGRVPGSGPSRRLRLAGARVGCAAPEDDGKSGDASQ